MRVQRRTGLVVGSTLRLVPLRSTHDRVSRVEGSHVSTVRRPAAWCMIVAATSLTVMLSGCANGGHAEAMNPARSQNPASASTGPSTSVGVTSDKIISRGRPAYSSVGVATDANDGEFATSWQVPRGETGWLAYDLSGVPADRRGEVVLAWYSDFDDGYTTGPIEGGCSVWAGRSFLGTYVVEVNSGPGGGEPPTSGWREVASVRDSLKVSGQHLVDMQGANWIRVRGSGPNGANINVDVAAAPSGDSGGWLFLGDSITTQWAGHNPLTGADGNKVEGVMQQLAQLTGGAEEVLGQNNGVSCVYASGAVNFIDQMLDEFHGKYVGLALGGNDGYGGQGDPEQYYSSLEQLVAKVEARGMVPMVATITWPNNGGAWDAKIQALNDQVRRLYQEHPEVLQGPDAYSLLQGRTELYQGDGNVHPNEAGSALLRQAWAQAIHDRLQTR